MCVVVVCKCCRFFCGFFETGGAGQCCFYAGFQVGAGCCGADTGRLWGRLMAALWGWFFCPPPPLRGISFRRREGVLGGGRKVARRGVLCQGGGAGEAVYGGRKGARRGVLRGGGAGGSSVGDGRKVARRGLLRGGGAGEAVLVVG